MAAAAGETCAPSDFEEWLAKRLKDINIDDEVFGSYILGVVDTDESSEEDKREALMGILAEITEEPVEETCNEILNRWQKSNSKLQQENEANRKEEPSTDAKMSSIMERHAAAQTKKEHTPNTEHYQDKRRLLARYAEVSDGENSDEAEGQDDGADESLMMKNTNKESVERAAREQRDKQKADYEKRREQERQQREKDRLRALERKEKEKKRTQKGEKRR